MSHNKNVSMLSGGQQENAVFCPKCGNKNISFSVALEEVPRGTGEGCFLTYILMVVLIFIPIIGWILLYAMITEKRKTKGVTYCLCSQCGCNWKLDYKAEMQKKKTNKKIIVFIIITILVIGAIIEFYFMAKYKGWI